MTVGEGRRVTGQALVAVVGHPFRRRHGRVGVVTGDTRHPASAAPRAVAQRQGLHMAYGPQRASPRVVVDERQGVLGEQVAGAVHLQRLSRAAHARLARQVALDAHRVAPLACQPGRVDQDADAPYVLSAGSVAALAAHAVLQEWRRAVSVRSARRRRLDPARVAEETGGGGRLQLHLTRRVVFGRHVPALLLDVVVDRRLVEEAFDLEQEGASARVRAHVVLKLVAAAHPGIAGPLVAEVGLCPLDRDAVLDARRLMPERALDQVPPRRAARARHRGVRVTFVDLAVAYPAGLVAHVRWLGRWARGEAGDLGRSRDTQSQHWGAHRGNRQPTGA